MATKGPIHLSGPPWLPPGDRKILAPNAIASKVLCKRHNELLSPLDALGTRFFASIPDLLEQPKHENEHRFFFYGRDFERWMLKVMCGVICARYVSGRSMPPLEWQPTIELLKVLLLGETLSQPAGLYFDENVGTVINLRPRVEVTLFADGQKPQGIALALHGLRFFLALDSPRKAFLEAAKYRPNELRFKTPQGRTSLLFYWDESHCAATAELKVVPNTRPQ